MAQQLTQQDVMAGIVELLNWTFGVSLGPADEMEIESEITRNWKVPRDRSAQEIVEYLYNLHTVIATVPADRRDALKKQAYGIIQGDFKVRKAGGRGRVMATIHRAIEGLRPGCTGVLPPPPPARPAPPQQPPMDHFLPPNYQPERPAAQDYHQRMLDEQQRAQDLTLRSNISALQHQTAMTVIGNIK